MINDGYEVDNDSDAIDSVINDTDDENDGDEVCDGDTRETDDDDGDGDGNDCEIPDE